MNVEGAGTSVSGLADSSVRSPRPPFFFLLLEPSVKEKKGGTRERERSKSAGTKGDYVRDASFWAAAIWVDCFGFFSLTSKLFFTLVSSWYGKNKRASPT